MTVQQSRSERRAEAYPLGYVEGLNDARTKLADFFSILLGGVRTCSLFSSLKNGVGKIGGTGPKL
jgi:hypothetical protein